MRVLIVEDNADIARNIGDYCETRGWTADYAMDGPGAGSRLYAAGLGGENRGARAKG